MGNVEIVSLQEGCTSIKFDENMPGGKIVLPISAIIHNEMLMDVTRFEFGHKFKLEVYSEHPHFISIEERNVGKEPQLDTYHITA